MPIGPIVKQELQHLVTPENFIQFRPSIQKLFMILFNTDGRTHRQTDGQTDGHTNSLQNKSPHYPKQVRAEIF